MTRDEAIELMARAINKAAGLPESDVDCWTEHATASIDALIAAGWTGPGDARNAALEEAAKVAKHMEAYGVAAAIRALKE